MAMNTKTDGVLRLFVLLTSKKRRTVQELQDTLAVTERTIYRYMDTLLRAGFAIEKQNGSYVLENTPANRQLASFIRFSQEEVWLIKTAIGNLPNKSELHQQLLRKLETIYETALINNASKAATLEKVTAAVQYAIEHTLRLKLLQYRSSNSGSIRDRLVEPFCLDDKCQSVWCCDAEDGHCKQFKLNRMAGAEVTVERFNLTERHIVPPCADVFGMSGEKMLGRVTLLMTLRARNLLTDEYGVSAADIKECHGKYEVTLPIAAPEGINRFVNGLLEDIEIVEGKKLLHTHKH
ncbi:MAG: WYL domain-containing protein [Bacteroidetes bacterium]|nr:MAG: WYL domain-containing protein [Bacteroidota bacterium]